MTHDPNKETNAERIARKKRERQEFLERQAFERENQPVDEEERKLAEYDDKNLEKELRAIGDTVAALSDEQFDRWVKKNSRAVRKAGGKGKVKKARTKAQKNSGCAVVGVALIGALTATLGAAGWAAVEVASALL